MRNTLLFMLLFVFAGLSLAGAGVPVAGGDHRSIAAASQDVQGRSAFELLQSAQPTSFLGTHSQTCNGMDAGENCTVTLTVALLDIDPEEPCAQVRLSGTITCGTTSCSFSRDVCANQAATESFSCGGKNFEMSTTASAWGLVARGGVSCDNVSASIL